MSPDAVKCVQMLSNVSKCYQMCPDAAKSTPNQRWIEKCPKWICTCTVLLKCWPKAIAPGLMIRHFRSSLPDKTWSMESISINAFGVPIAHSCPSSISQSIMDRVSVSGILVRSCLQTVSILSPSFATHPLNILSTNCCCGFISDPNELEAGIEYCVPYDSYPALLFTMQADDVFSEQGNCYALGMEQPVPWCSINVQISSWTCGKL
ncbi:hypothetical protein DI09_6p250 [Mitosporidium daphniae]|uniref:Uncharacterized protein n=1 Tax=Mitosporidium daphniae TaxID=1485682 RepID=A0A098VRV8_9MICR|nr:uncharacterized protein DI09_6p250 [Mitosporidium daphniae]KGG50441.1 hypothetical protein DI09_6p250 [Mitosporidium daphniae]|eukprot:XP_013236868.1 uncharacterized protein DI09_6p250 [Mitosporidium daphniae]